MGLGMFESKMVASSKLFAMEKYGYTYMEDLGLITKKLAPDVCVEDIGDGLIKVTYNGTEFTAMVRDYSPGRLGGQKCVIKKVDGDKDRQKKWVSVWDTQKH